MAEASDDGLGAALGSVGDAENVDLIQFEGADSYFAKQETFLAHQARFAEESTELLASMEEQVRCMC